MEKGSFIISKDHFGVKPLYYYFGENEICFSSELKAILPFSKSSKTVNEKALKNYLNFLYSPGEGTPLIEYKKVLPGTFISGNISDINNLNFHKYYRVPFNVKYIKNKSEKFLVDELEKKLVKAVDRQLLSDVPVGFFLSGGLDSSILVAIAKKLYPKKEINCYTIRAESTDGFTDDLYYAQKVAKILDVNLKIVDAKIDILEDFDKVIYHLDEPQADPAPINVYNICKQARRDGIKVLIGGAGGDDILTGYRRHIALNYEYLADITPLFIRKIIKFIFKKIKIKNKIFRRAQKLQVILIKQSLKE